MRLHKYFDPIVKRQHANYVLGPEYSANIFSHSLIKTTRQRKLFQFLNDKTAQNTNLPKFSKFCKCDHSKIEIESVCLSFLW